MRSVTAAAAAIAILAAASANAQMKKSPTAPVAPRAGQPGQIAVSGNNNVQMSPMQADQATLAAARRISRAEAMKLVNENKAVYVDVRSKAKYDEGHIKGALSIPHSQLMQRLREVPPGKMVITYCACVAEHSAAQSVLELNAHGFKNTAALIDGWTGWVAAKLPVETSK